MTVNLRQRRWGIGAGVEGVRFIDDKISRADIGHRAPRNEHADARTLGSPLIPGSDVAAGLLLDGARRCARAPTSDRMKALPSSCANRTLTNVRRPLARGGELVDAAATVTDEQSSARARACREANAICWPIPLSARRRVSPLLVPSLPNCHKSLQTGILSCYRFTGPCSPPKAPGTRESLLVSFQESRAR